jgi:alkylated DNA repair protein (DNA oxidative demethylase)
MAEKAEQVLEVDGAKLLPSILSRAAQDQMLAEVLAVIEAAPLYRPEMPRTGKPFSVQMTNAGPLGWVADKAGGYRYQEAHPVTGKPWPAIPQSLMGLWDFVAGYGAPPECCLVNYYAPGTKMGLHRDAEEAAKDAPVVSVSLGDRALFRVKGTSRTGPTAWSVKLTSGDVILLAGKARHYFHGIDRTYPGTSTLLPPDQFPEGGRINLTLRRVTRPTSGASA